MVSMLNREKQIISVKTLGDPVHAREPVSAFALGAISHDCRG
jgi:hypothetical protein